MSTLTITVSTTDAGDVEVTERSTGMRSFARSDVADVADQLERAAAKVRAAYGIATTPAPTDDEQGARP